MRKNQNQRLNFLLVTLMIVAMVLGALTVGAKSDLPDAMTTLGADEGINTVASGNVAKVGNTEYATIDEAIANWTNNSTLTLLADVTLSDVIQLSSTEYHILDLGTYTMTAASRKDAIQIVNNGRSSASYALDIKADATNPGGITASGKAVVKTTGKSGVKDRPIIRFYNGVFNASNIVSHSGSNGTNCPQFQFHGGVYNGSISTNRALLQFYGGTFNGRFYASVDSSAYTLIAGGRFKYLDNLYGSALNSDKFTIGSAKGVFDRGVYVDAEGYIVVGGPVITEVSEKYPAVASNASKAGSYLPYSSAATYGLFYEDAAMAIAKHGAANVTIYEKPAVTIPETLTGEAVEEIKNNTALKDYTPENLPKDAELEIELKSVGETFVYDVTPMANGTKVEPTAAITFRLPVPASVTEAYAKVYHEGTLMGIYEIKGEGNAKYVEISSADFSEFAVEPITHYEVSTYEELIAALANDNAYVVMKNDITATATQSSGYGKAGIVIDAGDVLDGNGCKLTIKGAGGTWDCAIAMRGGEVKNLTIAGAMRGVFMPGATGDVVIDNCVFENVIYTFNSDAGSKNHTVTIKNTTINGWTSFSDAHKAVTFENCKFGKGSGYAYCRPYQATTFIDCEFESGYEFDTTQVVENGLAFNDCTYDGEALSANNSDMFCDGGKVMIDGVSVSLDFVAAIGDKKYVSIADAIAALKSGDTLTLLADVDGDLVLPADVTLAGNGKQITGTLYLKGDTTFKGHVKANAFDFENVGTEINIPEGACFEITGTGRMIIGHGCTFNITGTITDAKTANVADLTPSLIMPGASFTGAGVTFNVTNAYIKAPSSYCSSSKSASGTFDFNITNSIIETAGKLAFEAQSVAATVNFELKDSVLTTGSHLVFGVSRGEIVIDNSNVNVGKSNQLENCSTMTIKNGSVVNGAVATSSNAKNPGTIIVENATYAVTGEFSGSDLGTGALVIKKGANISIGSVTKANITIDATDMAEGELANFAANLAKFAGTLEVINNDKLEASLVDGKIVLAKKAVAQIGDTKYYTLEDAFKAAQNSQTIKLLADILIDTETFTVADGVAITLDMNGKKITVTDNSTTNYELFYIYGEMTVTGNGTIEITATNNRAWNASSGIFHNRGGKLTVENGTFTHKGGTDMAFVIDNSGNWYGDAYTTINGGTITSTYIAIRNRMEQNTHGSSGTAYIVVNGGTINGTSRAIWAQAASTSTISPATGLITIKGGTVGLIDTARSAGAQSMTVIEGGTVAKFKGEVGELTVKGGTLEEATILTADGAEVAYAVNAEGLYVQAVASINGVGYATLAEAFAAGGEIKLLEDVTITSTLKVNAGQTIVLDLNGKTIDGRENVNIAIMSYGNFTLKDSVGTGYVKAGKTVASGMNSGNTINICSGTFTLESGNIYSLNNGILVDENVTTVYINGGTITAEKNTPSSAALCVQPYNSGRTEITINGGKFEGYFGILISKNTKLNIAGGEITGVYGTGLQGNGSYDSTEINISAGTIVGAEAAIYHPQGGILNITGGSFTGDTAIAVKGGKVTISGGTFSAIGEKADHVSEGSGFASTGDALYVEHYDNSTNSENYGTPVVTVTGGTFISANGKAVASYANTNNSVEALTSFISGGTFSSDVSELCADGFKAEANGDGTYGIVAANYVAQIGDVKYESLADAFAAAQDNDVIVLLADVTTSTTINVTKNLTIDGNGHTLTYTGSGASARAITVENTANGVNLTIKNLTVDCTASYCQRGINYNTNGELTLENVTVKGTNVTYALNLPGSSDNATVVINNSALTGNIALNVWGENATITANNTVFTSVDNSTAEGYSAIVLNNDGSTIANGTIITINGGKIVAKDEKGELAGAVRNATVTGEVNISGTTEVIGNYTRPVAIVVYEGYSEFYSFTTLQAAIDKAIETNGKVVLIANINLTSTVTVKGNVTLDLAGYVISGTCNTGSSALISINNGAKLTVEDSVGNGKITYAQGASNVGWTIDVKGEFVLESGTIELTGDSWSIGYAVDVRPNSWGTEYTTGSKFVMNGGQIISSDGGVRVASSSAAGHKNVSASFEMNGGLIDAAWDGVFIQQSDVVYDQLSFTMNGGTIESDLNPVRVYGPAPTSYVNGQNCIKIALNGGTMTYTGTEAQTWVIEGILRVGGGNSIETILENGTLAVSANIAQTTAAPAGYKWVANEGTTYGLVAVTYVAEVNGVKYETLQDAINAANGQTIVLLKNVDLGNDTLIVSNVEVVLDLNGYVLSGSESVKLTANDALIRITNGGKLTIKDSSEAKTGAITYGYTGEATGWGGYSASTIENNQGTLIVESGKIVSTTNIANQIAYAINSLTNGSIGDAYVTINGGEIIAAGSTAVRQFANSTTCINSLVINGGKITGRVQLQSSNKYDNKGELIINGGEIIREGNTAIEVWFSGGVNSEYSKTNVSIGGDVKVTGNIVFDEAPAQYSTKVITGGAFSSNVSEFVADGYECKANSDGTYGVEEKAEYTVEISSSTLVLKEAININFIINKSTLVEGTNYVAVIKKGNVIVAEVPYSQWTVNGNNMVVTYTGITAKEMADQFTIVIYDGDTQVSEERIDGVTEYVKRAMASGVFTNSNYAKLATLLVDMLNYGTAAQLNWNYNTENLANEVVKDYQSFATNTDVTFGSDTTVKASDNYGGTTISLKDRVILNFNFKENTLGNAAKAIITYTDHYGKTVSYEIKAEDFSVSKGRVTVVVDRLAAADARSIVTCTFVDANGAEIEDIYAQDSIANYCARAIAYYGAGTADANIYESVMKYADAAAKYFEKN